MKFAIFQSAKGDCFLLEAHDGTLVLCDGGMSSSMKTYVRAELAKLRQQGRELEYIYVSHVDNDHISGVLQLLQDEAVWRVYDHKKKSGDSPTRPKVPRPPKINGILHNGFSHLISKADQAIGNLANASLAADLLASTAPALFALERREASRIAEDMEDLSLGVKESIGVSDLIADDALDIPLNKPPGVRTAGKLLRVGGKGDRFKVGSMTWTLLGPTAKELKKLRDGWINYLRSADGRKQVKDIRSKIREQVDGFSSATSPGSPFDLRDWHGIPDYKGVTVPNISSMTFMVEEGAAQRRKRLLLTGDAQQDFILEGLETRGFLKKKGAIHVDVLKVPHHGSENNMDAGFAQRVSADHYVFGANGEHENPDLRVLRILYDSRFGPEGKLALAPEAVGREVHWWFSTTSKAIKGKTSAAYFAEVEKAARQYAKKSKGKLMAHFNTKASVTLVI